MDVGPGRLTALTDGVVAVIITIMAGFYWVPGW